MDKILQAYAWLRERETVEFERWNALGIFAIIVAIIVLVS